jgi:hypothetical protein
MSGTNDFVNEMEQSIEQEIRNKLETILGHTDSISDNTYIFYRSGCTGLLKHWITTSSPASPEEMAKEIYHLVVDPLLRIQDN